jgi:hypothetical protein
MRKLIGLAAGIIFSAAAHAGPSYFDQQRLGCQIVGDSAHDAVLYADSGVPADAVLNYYIEIFDLEGHYAIESAAAIILYAYLLVGESDTDTDTDTLAANYGEFWHQTCLEALGQGV